MIMEKTKIKKQFVKPVSMVSVTCTETILAASSDGDASSDGGKSSRKTGNDGKKQKMEFFIDDTTKTEYDTDYTMIERGNDFYLRAQLYYEGVKYVYYCLPASKDEGLLFIYLGDDIFDKLVGEVKGKEKHFAKIYPVLINAMYNGLTDNYSESALIKLPDLTKPEGASFWCLATKVENVDFSEFICGYTARKFFKLTDTFFQMLEEAENNDFSLWDKITIAAESGMKAYRRADLIEKVGRVLLGLGS